MKSIRFSVQSKYFSIYKAFVEELEAIGYTWNEEFNPNNLITFSRTSCIFVSNDWGGSKPKPQMSFSNPSNTNPIFKLDEGSFDEAVKFAKSEFERATVPAPIKVKLNREYTADVYGDKIVVGCQTFDALTIGALFGAAKETGLIK
jgi:hypothetical protein